MWRSESINSWKATKSILEFMCVSPFQEIKRYQITFYIALLLVYEVVFSGSIYMKFFYNGEAYVHIDNYDICYITDHIVWFGMGRMFNFGVILSLNNRLSQRELMNRMALLDVRLASILKVEPKFLRLNIEFIIYSVASSLYNYGYFVAEGIRNEDSWESLAYYFCSSYSANFYYIYAMYIVYWARVFLNRSEHVIDALQVVTSQKYISKIALTTIMELIKLLFDVRDTIQNAFGSMLCIIIIENSFLIAFSMYTIIELFMQNEESLYMWTYQLLWVLYLWLELVYIAAFFSKIGDLVSSYHSWTNWAICQALIQCRCMWSVSEKKNVDTFSIDLQYKCNCFL